MRIKVEFLNLSALFLLRLAEVWQSREMQKENDSSASRANAAADPSEMIVFQEGPQRLDQFINSLYPEHSRSLIVKWIQDELVQVNQNTVTKNGFRLRPGDQITWRIPELKKLSIVAEDIPLDIVYEDDDLLVINKAVGMVVHPGAGHQEGTLVNALMHHCQHLSGIGGVERPGIVHRLDKETSGLLAVAKNDQAHRSLSAQLQDRRMKRHYYALAEIPFKEYQGTIEAPIGRHPVERQRMAVVESGRFARTHWEVKALYDHYTWLALQLDTGRTHQIRVHLKHIQHPLVGDPVYGSKRKHPFKVERPLLHAYQLRFEHPKTDQVMCFDAKIPADFQRVLDILSSKQGG